LQIKWHMLLLAKEVLAVVAPRQPRQLAHPQLQLPLAAVAVAVVQVEAVAVPVQPGDQHQRQQ
jgi:hypothetical protein